MCGRLRSRLRSITFLLEHNKKMTVNKLFAWILLTVHKQPTTLNEVLYTADGINHIAPSLNELQTSFGWLQSQGLINKVENKYLLTEAGIKIKQSIPNGTIFSVWDTLAERLSQFPKIDFQPDEITEKEVAVANRINKKRFREIMKKLIAEK